MPEAVKKIVLKNWVGLGWFIDYGRWTVLYQFPVFAVMLDITQDSKL